MTAASVFRKSRDRAPEGFFAAEAAGLKWLAEGSRATDGPRVVGVVGVGADYLDLERVVPARATVDGARRFGEALARLHGAGAPAFGFTPTGTDGFFGPMDDPQPMLSGHWETWGQFYADARVAPAVEQGRVNGVFTSRDVSNAQRLVDALRAGKYDIGPDASLPARLHGDLWNGNVLWDADGAVLIDPAAHGGHRETDLAMLALFGAPYLPEILAGYEAVHPLATGWRERVTLHQIYPMLMHAVLFGGEYVDASSALLAQWGGA